MTTQKTLERLLTATAKGFPEEILEAMDAIHPDDAEKVAHLIDTAGRNPLHLLAMRGKGDPDLLEQCVNRFVLEFGLPSNRVADDGNRPLHLAAIEANAAMVRALVSGGANVNAKSSRQGVPPLMLAVRPKPILDSVRPQERLDTIKALLECDADPNATDESRDSVLHHALLSGLEPQVEIVDLLIAYGANPNAGSFGGHDIDARITLPLCLAACYGNETVVDALIAGGATVDGSGHFLSGSRTNPLLWALVDNNRAIVDHLVGVHGANINEPHLLDALCEESAGRPSIEIEETFAGALQTMLDCGMDPLTTTDSGQTLIDFVIEQAVQRDDPLLNILYDVVATPASASTLDSLSPAGKKAKPSSGMGL